MAAAEAAAVERAARGVELGEVVGDLLVEIGVGEDLVVAVR